jgi:hypothetical protein
MSQNRNSLINSRAVGDTLPIYDQDDQDDVQADSQQHRRRNNVRLLVLCFLATTLFIAVVVGGVCGAGKCPKGREYSAEAAQSQLDPTLFNDVCTKAVGPLTIGKIPSIGLLSGLTTTSSIPRCDGSGITDSTENAIGRWFSVTGGDEVIRISTCDRGANFTTTIDTVLSIFQGDDCDNLVCISTNDDFCGTSSSVSLLGEKGANYYIFVSLNARGTVLNSTSTLLSTEINSFESLRSKDFDFVLTVDAEENGICEDAIGPIEPVGNLSASTEIDIIPGSLRGSTSDPLAMKCDSNNALGGNVWYTVSEYSYFCFLFRHS